MTRVSKRAKTSTPLEYGVADNGNYYFKLNNKRKRDDPDVKDIEELISEIGCNSSLELLRPEEIGALTDAPIITCDGVRDDNGDLVEVDGPVYWFPNYMVEDPLETLLTKRYVEFEKAPEEQNRARVAAAIKACEAHRRATKSKPDGPEADIIDLVTDLHHYANHANVDWEKVLRLEKQHVEAETEGKDIPRGKPFGVLILRPDWSDASSMREGTYFGGVDNALDWKDAVEKVFAQLRKDDMYDDEEDEDWQDFRDNCEILAVIPGDCKDVYQPDEDAPAGLTRENYE